MTGQSSLDACGKDNHPTANAMIESERFARKVLNTSLNGLYIYDVLQGRHVFVNQQCTAMIGYTLEELQQMDRDRFFGLFHPDDRMRVIEHMQMLIAGDDRVREIEYRFRTKEGRWIWCLSRDGVFERDRKGAVVQLIGTFLDITDRRRAESALRESERRYRQLVETANSLIIRWRCDGTITFFNPYAEKVFGYRADEVIGKHVNLLVPPQESTGADLTGLAQDIVDHPRRYTSNINENICRDGRRLWIAWTNKAILDRHGRVEEILAIGSDVNEQKQAEAALRVSEEKFSRAFYSSPSLLFICELETGIFIEVNDAYCQLTGFSAEEMIGRSSLTLGLITAQSRSGIIRRLRRAGRVKNLELQIRTKTGEIKPCLFSAETMAYQNRRCLVYSGVDLTERKKAEEILRGYNEQLEMEVKHRTAEIEDQYRQLSELNLFIKQMAQHTIQAMESDRRALSKEIHDSIAGSLAAIKMLLETRLQDSNRPPPRGRMTIERIIGHLSDVIKESKHIAYQMRSLALDDFGLTAALSETVRKFKEFYPSVEVDFQVHITHSGIGDEIKTVVYRVIQEALNNVGKHSGADFVKVRLAESEDRLWLSVEDNGCGFDASRMLRPGQPLQGYGMLSMKERVEICNGLFQVQSEPGTGTLLSASIPKIAL